MCISEDYIPHEAQRAARMVPFPWVKKDPRESFHLIKSAFLPFVPFQHNVFSTLTYSVASAQTRESWAREIKNQQPLFSLLDFVS